MSCSDVLAIHVKTNYTCIKCLDTAVSGAHGKIVQSRAVCKQQTVMHAYRLHLGICGCCYDVRLMSEVHCSLQSGQELPCRPGAFQAVLPIDPSQDFFRRICYTVDPFALPWCLRISYHVWTPVCCFKNRSVSLVVSRLGPSGACHHGLAGCWAASERTREPMPLSRQGSSSVEAVLRYINPASTTEIKVFI